MSLGVYAACIDPITGEEHLYEGDDGTMYVLSKASGKALMQPAVIVSSLFEFFIYFWPVLSI